MAQRPEAGHHRRRRRRARRRVSRARVDPRHPDQRGRLVAVHRARLQLLREPQLEGQPGAARPGLPPGPELRDRPQQDRRHRLQRLRPAGLVADRALLALPLAAAGRRHVHLRPGQGQPDARRRRLQDGRQRLPHHQAGQAADAAPDGHDRLAGERDRRQARRAVVQERRREGRAVDRRPGRADERPVPVHRQHLHAQLGHVHVVLDPGRRPGLHGEHLHAGAVDRLRLERLPLDRSRLHEALQRGRDHDRPGAAHPDRAAGRADLLLRLALRDHGLPLPARGLEHEQMDGLDQGAGGDRRGDLRLQQHRHLHEPAAERRTPRAPAARAAA